VICPYCGHDNVPGVDLCESCGSDLAGLDLPEAEEGFRGQLFTDRIGDLHLMPPLTVSPQTTVADAISRMREARHGCVLVQDGDTLVGIFTERDVLVRGVHKGLDMDREPVASVMTPEPFTLKPDDPPIFAIHCMVVEGLRHLPVVEGDQLLGFISVRNVLRYIHRDVLGG
jgi:CBS domain-containing protein